jgi:hypothetical protein
MFNVVCHNVFFKTRPKVLNHVLKDLKLVLIYDDNLTFSQYTVIKIMH